MFLVRSIKTQGIWPISTTEDIVPSRSHGEIGTRVAKAALWTILLRLVFRLIGLVNQLILVRLLVPEDFGLIASAGVIYSMLDMLSSLSTSMALMQMPNPSRNMYDTAWTLGILRGLAISVALLLSASAMGEFMQDDRITRIVQVLSIASLISGFESVGMVILARRLEFQRIFLYQSLNKVLGFMIVMPIAIMYRSYWALVFGGFAARFLTIPLSYAFAPYRPAFSLVHVRELLHFSKWLFVNNMLTMVDNSLMTMTLGRLYGPREVGLYQVSLDLGAMPASEIAAPIRGPMYAGYARIADDVAALREHVLSGFALLVMIVLPMSAGIAATSDFVAHVALGAKWTDAGPIVTWSALYALFDAIGHFTGNVYIVRHAQRPYVVIMAVALIIRIMLVVPAALYGGVHAAVAWLAISALINAFLWFAWLRPLIHGTWGDFCRATWRSVAATGIMVTCVAAAQLIWPREQALPAMMLQWAILCGLGAVVHIGMQLLLWQVAGRPSGPEMQIMGAVASFYRRFGPAWAF
jgi:lipopolysaccharide exporter